ncbi:MAG TPA: hypothetical protein VKE74_15345, partial [Gemmataceae bacterium]|nr:hypothetical protein [Gemmataceae bacterium]
MNTTPRAGKVLTPLYLGLVALILAAGVGAWMWLRSGPSQPAGQSAPTPPAEADPGEADGPPVFEDVTAGSGVAFTYRNGEEADRYTILESLGGGVALFDYDGDGRLDIFLTGGGDFSGPDRKQIVGRPSKLYRNLGG